MSELESEWGIGIVCFFIIVGGLCFWWEKLGLFIGCDGGGNRVFFVGLFMIFYWVGENE